MIFLFILCFGILFIGVRKRAKGENPLAPAVTTSINGIFVLMVMLTHFYQYAGKYLTSLPNTAYGTARFIMGQTVVATFLFFSGYGMMEQISKKKQSYARSIFKNRFLKVLFHFDLALILFIIMGIVFKRPDKPLKILTSLIGWSKLSIGNSNWFMFTTFCLYIIVFIAFFRYDEKKPIRSLSIMTALVGIYILLICLSPNNSSRFYNTVFCFVVGMWFSHFKNHFFAFIRKSKKNYIFSLILCVAVGTVFAILCTGHENVVCNLLYNFYALAVAFFFILLAEKLTFGNKVLLWLGKYTFPIYILQRIPYILFREVGLLTYSIPLYFIVCVVSTLILAYCFQHLTNWLDRLIW
ncbi:MAG: acyltransferase [Ruminococcaceae bacterium]|nr:acyltransferase [Oscillospiraceae bacterium]